MKKLWNICYAANGGEYTGLMQVTAQSVRQIDISIIVADDVQIDVGEVIEEIEVEEE
jgi:hypothetical protein